LLRRGRGDYTIIDIAVYTQSKIEDAASCCWSPKIREMLACGAARRRNYMFAEFGMTVYESKLTTGNFTLEGKRPHIYITSFYKKLPADVFDGTSVYTPAPRTVRLEFGTLTTDTFVTTDKKGRPRTFFQDRSFVREFFSRTGAKPDDVVLFEEVNPYHFRLSLRTIAGKVVSS